MAETRVDLSSSFNEDRSYDIVVSRGTIDDVGPKAKALGFAGECAVVTNHTVGELYLERVVKSLEGAGFMPFSVKIPDGEEYKILETAATVIDSLVEERFERGSLLIALGGGVVGDLAGFVASSYLRGVPYLQIPTTLLSQVDSSVGGKTAVNHSKGKNLIGAFYQPKIVIIDPDVLKTLDLREKRAGLAEVVKYGIIWDAEFFDFLERSSGKLLDDKSLEIEKAIIRSCEIKASVVSSDEKEAGLRAILNFGHTFGHAIEACTGYSDYKHGEAVSMGMVLASDLSVKLGKCPVSVSSRVRELLENLGLVTGYPGIAAEKILQAVKLDKKVSSGEIKFVLLNDIGSVEVESVSEPDITDFLNSL